MSRYSVLANITIFDNIGESANILTRIRPHVWRQIVGLLLLGCVVVFWTASAFFTSSIFANDRYAKPYFVVYFNTAFFVIPLVPIYLRYYWRQRGNARRRSSQSPLLSNVHRRATQGLLQDSVESTGNVPASESLPGRPSFEDALVDNLHSEDISTKPLTLRQTMQLSLRFCFVWFAANWFTSASYEYTSVASCTILTATSSIFTLIIGSFVKVEKFTFRKLGGVLFLFCGIFLTTAEDLTGKSDAHRGKFPHKSPSEIAIGDTMALLSAVLYGFYATGLTKSVGDETRVNMPVFFGFVGVINIALLWPGLIVLHLLGIERFEPPPSSRIWGIVVLNAVVSLFSDICWGYSMVLLSPLVTTVGLSLTIPLSLIGQMVFNHQGSSPLYWLGAIVVVLSFVFINYESSKETRRRQQLPEDVGD